MQLIREMWQKPTPRKRSHRAITRQPTAANIHHITPAQPHCKFHAAWARPREKHSRRKCIHETIRLVYRVLSLRGATPQRPNKREWNQPQKKRKPKKKGRWMSSRGLENEMLQYGAWPANGGFFFAESHDELETFLARSNPVEQSQARIFT